MSEVTTDLILGTIEQWVSEKHPVSPSVWVDAALKLNILVSTDISNLYVVQQRVAQLKVQFMEQGDTAAKAKIKSEATDDYRQMCLLKAKIGRIDEFIKLAKVQARMTGDEIKGYN